MAKRINSTTPLESWDGPGGVEEKSGVEQEREGSIMGFSIFYTLHTYIRGALLLLLLRRLEEQQWCIATTAAAAAAKNNNNDWDNAARYKICREWSTQWSLSRGRDKIIKHKNGLGQSRR